MTPEHHRRVGRLYREAREMPPEQRSSLLANACAGDAALKREVESLLGYDALGHATIDANALEVLGEAMAAEQTAAWVAQRISHYQILAVLSRGGMGELYRARDIRLGRDVAIKALPLVYSADPARLQRFEQEARAAGQLNHPNVLTVYDIGVHDGAPFIVFELLEGEELRRQLNGRALPLGRAIGYARQIARGLAATHEKGIVHRDLKPENLFVTSDERVKILDFGLAKLTPLPAPDAMTSGRRLETSPGLIMGTIGYLSPEQLRGEPADHRADVFAFGVILYEMLTGERPFERGSPADTMAAILNAEPPDLRGTSRPPLLNGIVRKCLEKDPERRFQSASDLGCALEGLSPAPGTSLEAPFVSTTTAAMADTGELRRKEAPAGGPEEVRKYALRPLSWRSAVLILVSALLAIFALPNRRPVSTAGPIRALAVLPFQSLSADTDHAYFADGMTDAVITDLASISALRVVSHQSVRRYRTSAQPLADIARELGVDAIVQGSVGRSEGRVRVTAQLVDARSDQHLWAGSYDRELDDVLALQGELARAVAGAVHVAVSGVEREALSTRRTVDPGAYDAYLRGRFFFAQRSERALAKSIDHYRQAIDRDPTFAAAYAGLALAYGPLGFFGYIPAAEASHHLRASAKKALQLDPRLVEADVALAAAKMLYDWDWHGGERAYSRIFERSPNQAQARLWYGFLLGCTGRLGEALAERERALQAEPLSLQFNTSVADTLTLLGRFDDAIVRYRRTLELDASFAGAHQGLGVALLRSGHNDEAIGALEEGVRLSSDPRSLATLGYAYGVLRRSAHARRILEQLEGRARNRYLTPVYPAFVYAGLGDLDAAFERLEEAFRDRSPMLGCATNDPLLDPLRGDQRFDHLLRRMNLPLPSRR